MQHTPRAILMQFSQLMQMDLFPILSEQTGDLSAQAKLLAEAISLTQLERFHQRQWRGRPCESRKSLLIAFLAKSIYNLSTTRHLLDRLRTDPQLRSLCGWLTITSIPSESTFSRAFAEFARRRVPEHIHEGLIRQTHSERIIGHIARDSTAIEARERFPETPSQKARRKPVKSKRKLGQHLRAKAKDQGLVTRRQRHMKLDEMLEGLSRECSIGVKKNSKGHQNYWRGYKLHLDVGDGQIPVSAILTGANVHDARVAIPLMNITSNRVTYLYDLMDAAYDAQAIQETSKELGHLPIINPNGRRATRKPSQCPKVRPPKLTPELCPAKQERYKIRTMAERVNARLKDEFGGRTLRVRGPVKAMAHLMFGVIALTVDQLLKQIE